MTVAAFAAPNTLLGLEHEFVVSSGAGVVDFRSVIHGLRLGQPNLDPCAPYAYRLPSGAVVTCDAAEAEIALPPTRVRPGFAFEVARRAGVERLALIGRVPAEIHLEGYSTHLSVGVSDLFTKAVCQAYAKRFAPAMMLFGDRRDSPGLLVRPRPGRVELGVEYLASDQLVAASIFAVASVLTCLRAVSSARDDDLPAELDVRIDPAVQRFGSYVDRRAFGGDLLADGRAAELRGVDGGDVVTAQTHLEHCWRVARATVELLASAEELALVDATVRGERPLPSERVMDAPLSISEDPTLSLGPVYGAALATRKRGSFDVAPVMLSWELAVFLILGRRRRRRLPSRPCRARTWDPSSQPSTLARSTRRLRGTSTCPTAPVSCARGLRSAAPPSSTRSARELSFSSPSSDTTASSPPIHPAPPERASPIGS